MSKEVLVLEDYATKEISLSQKSIKEILKDSEGNLIVYSKATVKKNLLALVKKNEAEINKLIALPQLTVKEEQKLTELRKLYKDSRISLDKITKHNASVLAGASKQSKVVQEELTDIVKPVEDKITVRLAAEEARRDKAREEKENEEKERKDKIYNYIQERKEDFQVLIYKTKTFEDIAKNKDAWKVLVSSIREVLDKKEFNLQEFEEDYEEMLKDQAEVFQDKIDKLTEAKNLQDREEALAVVELTNARKGELLDYGLNYKGEANLGELSLEEYAEILVPAKVKFRAAQIEELGFTQSVSDEDIWIYSPNENIVLQTVDRKTMKMLNDEVWEAFLVESKQQIEDYNNPKEEKVEEVPATEETAAEAVVQTEAEEQPAETDEEGAVISLQKNVEAPAGLVGYLSIVDFPERNVEIAKDQPQYQTLPAYVDSKEGTITSCWELTPEQIAEVGRTGKIWLRVLTFGNPLQPVLLSVLKEDFIK